MSRPPLEVADLIRAAGTSFFERSRKWFTWLHLKILTAIVSCRTSLLGGHIDECSGCGHRAISFNSCRNRHCPKCQSNARDRLEVADLIRAAGTSFFERSRKWFTWLHLKIHFR